MLPLVLLIALALRPVENANILLVTTFQAVSHQSAFQPLWKELSLRGHKVTAIVSHPLNDKSLTNLTEVDISDISKEMKAKMPMPMKELTKLMIQKRKFLDPFYMDVMATSGFSKMHRNIMEHEKVQAIIKGNQEFDLVITEWLWPTAAAFSHRFNCPLVGYTSLGAPVVALDAIGNPSHPIAAPDHNLPLGRDLSFRDRALSTIYSIYVRVFYHLVVLPREDRTVKAVFGEDYPYLGDIENNVSVILLNRNPIIHKIMPVLPNVVELWKTRNVTNNKKLDPEVKQFLDNSKNGVVYFSLGSNVLSSNLPDELIEKYISAFEQIPYNVLWKWETDKLPRQPKNVFIHKWLPQTAVLAHPNVKLFMTQGGLQSMEETITYHVPIIGMPSHSDQTMNVDTAVKYGFGIGIDFDDLTVDKLKKAIMEIMTNESYKENVKKIEKLMNDVPTNGLEKAIWWIEYVIRHKGAKHLRSPAMDIPWYQYLLLDVMALIFSVLFLLLAIIYVAVKMTIKLCKSIMSKTKKTKKE